jgi:hypothetical protein
MKDWALETTPSLESVSATSPALAPGVISTVTGPAPGRAAGTSDVPVGRTTACTPSSTVPATTAAPAMMTTRAFP